MAVSKRLRFEILRRDGFRCYYCGTRSNETADGLTVDHVTPTALGGSDLPDNLVAACSDCNAGKSATLLDGATVAAVVEDVNAAQEARRDAAAKAAEKVTAEDEFAQAVRSVWGTYAPSYVPFPVDGAEIIGSWLRDNVPLPLVEKAFAITWGRKGIAKTARLRYAAGVVRSLLAEAGAI